MEKKNLPKIYSKQSILGFSILFSTLFGGFLLYRNLVETKKKTEAYTVLGVSVGLMILTIIIGSLQEDIKSSYGYLSGLIGGCILSYYFFPKYFPDEEQYEKKPIWKPLIIGIAIVVIIITLIISSGSLENG